MTVHNSFTGSEARAGGSTDQPARDASCQPALELKPDDAEAHNHRGIALRGQGKLEEAVACYRRALGLRPEYAEAHYNLGNALKAQRKLEEAIACYRRAVQLKPDYVGAHNNLGNALSDQGKLEEATACYRRAVELKPDDAEAHYNLGLALHDQRKPAEAIACYRRALELKPGHAKACNCLGMALRSQGKLEEAVTCYRRAVELKPDYAAAHYNLGNALKAQRKLEEAIACYRRAVALNPHYFAALSNLGHALSDQGKLEEAVPCYRRAVELRPRDAEAHHNLGLALSDQRKPEEAVACYRRALELKPDYAAAHGHLGAALRRIGDLRGAEDCCRAALRCDPRFAFAYSELADLLGDKLPQEDLAAQRRLLAEGELPDAQRMLLHFALARVLDARGEYAEAAGHLERANALQLSERQQRGRAHDPERSEFAVTRTIAVCTPEFFQRVRGFGLESELPVFVVGLPRSGTTLVEQILASHGQVFGGGELDLVHDTVDAIGPPGPRFFEGLERLNCDTTCRLAARHLEALRALDGQALRIVDKMPENYLHLGLLATLFPRAKFIHCRRDLRDVAVSCWITNFAEVRWANDHEHIASRFHAYQRLMEHWRKVLPVPLLNVDYEETVADLEGVARKLVAWCGLAWEPACLQFHQTKRSVKTASSVQVRRPLYSTSVGRWKHYERALAPLFARLEGRQG